MEKAADGDHTRLAFDRAGTWSQKYNLAWDRVLGLNLFSDELKASEMAWYKKTQNEFGCRSIRAPTTPSSTGSRGRRRSRINAPISTHSVDRVALFLDKTPDRVPMSDWYDTKTARDKGMHARPVVGRSLHVDARRSRAVEGVVQRRCAR
jgi:hypothetical protein